MRLFLVFLSALLLGAVSLLPPPAHAAQSYDSCTGFIDSLPATIGTQGTWCLRKDLSTAQTSGSAIRINANNVTIDCNDFKIGGLDAGTASFGDGIYAFARQNVAVRNCRIRGFYVGIRLSGDGGAGHMIEDNHLDLNLHTAIHVRAIHSVVRRNRILDTGGRSQTGGSGTGIAVSSLSEVSDNLVAGVSPSGNVTQVRGISVSGYGNRIRGNTVRGLRAPGTNGSAFGIDVASRSNRIERNDLADADAVYSFGVLSGATAPQFCGSNAVSGFKTPIATTCVDIGGNNVF